MYIAHHMKNSLSNKVAFCWSGWWTQVNMGKRRGAFLHWRETPDPYWIDLTMVNMTTPLQFNALWNAVTVNLSLLPKALVFKHDTRPSVFLPDPIWMPAAKPAGVLKTQHPAWVFISVEAQVGMFWKIIDWGEAEKPWHPKAENHIHRLLGLMLGDLAFTVVIILNGREGEYDLFTSGLGFDAVGIAAEWDLLVFIHFRFLYGSTKHKPFTHLVDILAGQMEFRAFRHSWAGNQDRASET